MGAITYTYFQLFLHQFLFTRFQLRFVVIMLVAMMLPVLSVSAGTLNGVTVAPVTSKHVSFKLTSDSHYEYATVRKFNTFDVFFTF